MSVKWLDQSELKAATGARTHTIEFYALAFQQKPDRQGDIIDPGAVDAWLAEFYKSGSPLAISFTHSAIRDPGDPFNIIGHAPADPQHVFKDEHGLRVIAELDTSTNAIAQQVYTLTKRGIVKGASVAYVAEKEKVMKDGSVLIQQMSLLECGPCLDPANDQAYVIAVKNAPEQVRDELESLIRELPSTAEVKEDLELLARVKTALETKAVDTSTWDGKRAMSECSTAAQYDAICAAAHNIGNPDERQHWAGPHHFLGRGPNQGGVGAALSRWGTDYSNTQVGNISEAEWSGGLAHLRAHAKQINPDYEPPKSAESEVEAKAELAGAADVTLAIASEIVATKAGRALSKATEAKIRQIQGLIDELLSLVAEVSPQADEGAKANEEEPETANSDELGPNDWLRRELERATA